MYYVEEGQDLWKAAIYSKSTDTIVHYNWNWHSFNDFDIHMNLQNRIESFYKKKSESKSRA